MRERWRYRCPDCRNTSLCYRNSFDEWYCEHCQQRYERRWDAKNGKLEKRTAGIQ